MQSYKRQAVGQEVLDKEREEALLAERKRRFGKRQ